MPRLSASSITKFRVTAAYFAERLGHTNAADLLRQTLEEEQNTDTKLNDLAVNYINAKAQ